MCGQRYVLFVNLKQKAVAFLAFSRLLHGFWGLDMHGFGVNMHGFELYTHFGGAIIASITNKICNFALKL